eukprot:jgi/Ulvmu1/9950/UM058_0033.1
MLVLALGCNTHTMPVAGRTTALTLRDEDGGSAGLTLGSATGGAPAVELASATDASDALVAGGLEGEGVELLGRKLLRKKNRGKGRKKGKKH